MKVKATATKTVSDAVEAIAVEGGSDYNSVGARSHFGGSVEATATTVVAFAVEGKL